MAQKKTEVQQLSEQQLRWLLEGLSIEQKRKIEPATPSHF